MKRRAFALGGLLLLATSSQVWAADLPPNFQAIFLLRILAYDRNLKTRAGDAVNILVVYQDGNDGSDSTKGEILKAVNKIAKDTQVSGLPVRISALAYSDANGLDGAISGAKAAALYLCPGLDSSVGAIQEVTRRRSVLTFTGVEPWVRQGISVGLVARESKPAVVVNLAASKEEGADLDPALLRLAEVIR
jgi:YfiR/HmsC-like